jgi:hypothetical protein
VLPDKNKSLPVCTEFTKLAAGAASGGKVMFSALRRASAPAGAWADAGLDNTSKTRLAARMPFMSDLLLGSRKKIAGHDRLGSRWRPPLRVKIHAAPASPYL